MPHKSFPRQPRGKWDRKKFWRKRRGHTKGREPMFIHPSRVKKLIDSAKKEIIIIGD